MSRQSLLEFDGPKELGRLNKVINDEGTIYYVIGHYEEPAGMGTIKLGKPKKDNPVPKSIREGNFQTVVGSLVSGVVFETKYGLSIVMRDKTRFPRDKFYPYIDEVLKNKMPSYPLIEYKKTKLVSDKRLRLILHEAYRDLIRVHQNNYLKMYGEMKSKIDTVTKYLHNLQKNIPIVFEKLIENKGNHNDDVYRTTFQLDSLVNIDVIIGKLINETEHLNRKLIYAYGTLDKS